MYIKNKINFQTIQRTLNIGIVIQFSRTRKSEILIMYVVLFYIVN